MDCRPLRGFKRLLLLGQGMVRKPPLPVAQCGERGQGVVSLASAVSHGDCILGLAFGRGSQPEATQSVFSSVRALLLGACSQLQRFGFVQHVCSPDARDSGCCPHTAHRKGLNKRVSNWRCIRERGFKHEEAQNYPSLP